MPRTANTSTRTAPATPSLDRAAFRRALGEWFEKHRRILPWRVERTLYRTVVSEFMLQQTQVATVLPYFERWMQALPDFQALAAADESTVLKLWEGLGYYRRARFLHQLARELAAMPEPPRTAAGWAALTGVGPYTAAAIASLAFEDPSACVDGNVVRILARITDDRRSFPDASSAVKAFTALAEELLDRRGPGRHNEAMMELGATVCFRRKPLCTVCPVLAHCRAARKGTAEEIPAIARPAAEKREVARVWVERDGALLLHRIPEGAARMSGLHELPSAESLGLAAGILSADCLLATHRRAITRYQITERIYGLACPDTLAGCDAETLRGRDLVWVSLESIDTIPLSGPHRRWVTALLRR